MGPPGIRGKMRGKKSWYYHASCWGTPVGCRSPSFFRSNVVVRIRSDAEMVPPLPLFWFASWSGFEMWPPDCRRVARQWGCPAGFQAITPHEWLPEKTACDALPPSCIPEEESVWPALVKGSAPGSVCQQNYSCCLWALESFWVYFCALLVVGGNLVMKPPPQKRTYQLPFFQWWI